MTLQAVHRVACDVAIVGSGFAGAILALILRQQGQRVALIDRARHPRFAIGESSTPLANLLIEELADRYDLPRLRAFSKWGTWQATHPAVTCGRKRGFSFFQHTPGQLFADDASHARQMLVAASPNDVIADTHWYRPEFDQWLAREAADAGAVLLEETDLDALVMSGDRCVLDGTRHGRHIRIDTGFIVDASGPRGYLWRTLGLGDAVLDWLPPTQAVYAHFTGVHRWDALVTADATPPYPVDEAAVHHVLPGGWIWVLRFANGVTSAGMVGTDEFASRYAFADGEAGWQRVLADFPSVAAQFAGARAVTPFVYAPRVAHRTAAVCGDRWALLPSAVGVIDPLLSTGFPLTLLGIARMAALLAPSTSAAERADALRRYADDTVEELRVTERLVAALYGAMDDFALFKRLSLLYFAAASYAETVRRLGQPQRARGFLLQADPVFGPALRAITDQARTLTAGHADAGARDRLCAAIDAAIAPFDVAGLGDAGRRDWYPVRARDLHAARERLGVSASAIDALLARCGFTSDDAAGTIMAAGAGA
jgi:FADH2 O2-dependent halogenase